MKRSLVVGFVGMISVFSSALMGGWEAGDAPKYDGEMKHETEAELPKDRDRKKIGVGEKVKCTIEESKYIDCDKNPDNAPPDDVKKDTLGKKEWSTSDCTVEAKKEKKGTAHVEVALDDKPDLFDDAETVHVKMDFEVIVPKGLKIIKASDQPYNVGPGKWMDCDGNFVYKYQPETVNFRNVMWVEDVAVTKWKWPDGTNDENSGSGGSTGYGSIIDTTDGDWNIGQDHVTSGDKKKSLLNGQAYTVKGLNTHVSWAAEDGGAKHDLGVQLDMEWEFKADGSGRSTVTVHGTTDTKSTNFMGPWDLNIP